MQWRFDDDDGSWEAVSAVDGQYWRIFVCHDGTFAVSASASGLLPSSRYRAFWDRLQEAKDFCEKRESILLLEKSWGEASSPE